MTIFGQGVTYPTRTAAGRLVLSSGEERIFESIQLILETPQGTCPLDPRFGIELAAYEPVGSPTEVAWHIARAIERGEPRIADLEVAVVGADADTLHVDIRFVPIGSTVQRNRVFPFYRKV